MSVTITQVRNAKSLNAENTFFDLEINHPQLGWIPYTLNPNDTDQTIDNDELVSLIGSSYEAYVAPTQEELDAHLAARLRLQRDLELENVVDPIVTNPLRWAELTEAKQAEWQQYRLDLLNYPQQDGFPNDATFPTAPE